MIWVEFFQLEKKKRICFPFFLLFLALQKPHKNSLQRNLISDLTQYKMLCKSTKKYSNKSHLGTKKEMKTNVSANISKGRSIIFIVIIFRFNLFPHSGAWRIGFSYTSYARTQAGNKVLVCFSAFDMLELRILRAGNKATPQPWSSGDQTLDLDVLGRILQETSLERRGDLKRRVVQESWLIFKGHLFPALEWSFPMSRMSSKGTRRSAWMNKELLTKLKCKKEVCKKWEQVQVIQEECRDTESACLG